MATDLAPGLLDFFQRGFRAQAEVDRILEKHGAEQLLGPDAPNPAPVPEAGGGPAGTRQNTTLAGSRHAASEISSRRPSQGTGGHHD